ncbi:MAG: Glu-tRNA(Gln) amidotransferase subunit GatE [Nanoarchaeota archaeon]
MDGIDYKNIGFRCGLEIHQQLETGKLFCRCPSIVHDFDPDIHVRRRLRPVAGEGGHIDPAALFEATKGRAIQYEGCSTSCCLVELDEEPPHEMDNDAFIAALQVAKMMHCKTVDEVRVMRKIVIDGSNVSGFQRTSLIGTGGFIETSKGRVGIAGLFLEEESAQKVNESSDVITYRLDRLGIPLIEVQTDASISDPDHAKEAAETIGMILRSTGRAKRGIGTIRQDVNVSVSGGARVEIKGFQELKGIPGVIDFEIRRQSASISKGERVNSEVRRAEPDLTTSFLRPMPGAKRMYPETDVAPVRITPELLASIKIPPLLKDQIDGLAVHFSLDKDIAATIVNDGIAEDFKALCEKCKSLKPSYIADVLLSGPKQAKKKSGRDVSPTLHEWTALFLGLDSGAVSKESVIDILATGKPLHDILGRFKSMGDAELDLAIKRIVDVNKGLPFNALIGKVMAELRGKADGKKIADRLKDISK